MACCSEKIETPSRKSPRNVTWAKAVWKPGLFSTVSDFPDSSDSSIELYPTRKI